MTTKQLEIVRAGIKWLLDGSAEGSGYPLTVEELEYALEVIESDLKRERLQDFKDHIRDEMYASWENPEAEKLFNAAHWQIYFMGDAVRIDNNESVCSRMVDLMDDLIISAGGHVD